MKCRQMPLRMITWKSLFPRKSRWRPPVVEEAANGIAEAGAEGETADIVTSTADESEVNKDDSDDIIDSWKLTVFARSTPALSEMDRTPQSPKYAIDRSVEVRDRKSFSFLAAFDYAKLLQFAVSIVMAGCRCLWTLTSWRWRLHRRRPLLIRSRRKAKSGKKKQPMDVLNCTNHEVKDFFPILHGSSTSKLELESTASIGKQKVSVLETLDFSFHEETSYGEHDESDFYDEYDYDYDYDMDVFGDDTMNLTPVIQDEIESKFKAFKQFDTPCKDWAKTIQHEWKVLENDLPETIYVRVYEDRMDLLRAVIIGPAGTPYHDGGLRLNPNLYESGKVCLSLLNTWSGHGCERWDPLKSTMLQVLVSIQALVLNSKPYFNEPGYANLANTPRGEEKSLDYNEKAFILSCKTMLYSLRKPPKHFEDFVAGHFRSKGQTILVACKAYIEGAQVGCVVGDGVQDVDEGDKSSSSNFKKNLSELFEQLLMEFAVKGADCSKILAQKVIDGAAKAAATASSGSRHI
ncbi:hypothetical protein HPP92_010057 [Vanilla planifolia]|uniref:UBC core domain-containing protein n=1 Tax=Vanilla planifolia TaxID=51239 RepID=A0A835V613_VANPL|nr:hypothetical protein HPP92_010057 [Vanilla planifolia]